MRCSYGMKAAGVYNTIRTDEAPNERLGYATLGQAKAGFRRAVLGFCGQFGDGPSAAARHRPRGGGRGALSIRVPTRSQARRVGDRERFRGGVESRTERPRSVASD